MKAKKVCKLIRTVWIILAIILLVFVFICRNKSEWQPLIGNLAFIYSFASCVLAGMVYKLQRKK